MGFFLPTVEVGVGVGRKGTGGVGVGGEKGWYRERGTAWLLMRDGEYRERGARAGPTERRKERGHVCVRVSEAGNREWHSIMTGARRSGWSAGMLSCEQRFPRDAGRAFRGPRENARLLGSAARPSAPRRAFGSATAPRSPKAMGNGGRDSGAAWVLLAEEQRGRPWAAKGRGACWHQPRATPQRVKKRERSYERLDMRSGGDGREDGTAAPRESVTTPQERQEVPQRGMCCSCSDFYGPFSLPLRFFFLQKNSFGKTTSQFNETPKPRLHRSFCVDSH